MKHISASAALARAAILAAGALLGGCCQPPTEPESVPASTELGPELPFRTLLAGQQTGLQGTRIARGSGEWNALWKEHASIRVPSEPAPQVDFERDMVIGLVLGQRPSAGYTIEIRSVALYPDALIAEAVESVPAPDSLQAAVMTRPFHFVAVARTDRPVRIALR